MAATQSTQSANKGEQQKQDVQKMRTLLGTTGNQSGWDQAWQNGLTPWETMLGNVAQSSLRWACEENEEAKTLIPKSGRALVPGCGRGQDVAYLAEKGLDTIGLDISPTAVKAARQWLQSKGEHAWQDRARVECVDYFDLSTGPGKDAKLTGVDLIYDYTFFCAIPSELHQKWANAHAAALRSDGVLVCLAYPLRPEGDDSQSGPPFFVTTDLYTSLLQDHFTLAFHQTPDKLPDHKIGKETVMIWKRK